VRHSIKCALEGIHIALTLDERRAQRRPNLTLLSRVHDLEGTCGVDGLAGRDGDTGLAQRQSHPQDNAAEDIRSRHARILRRSRNPSVKIAAMSSGPAHPLLLGLLAPRASPALPPIPILAARAGWDAVWLPAGEPSPGEAGALGMRIGWVVDDAALPIPGGAMVWLRGSAMVPAQAIAAAFAAEPAAEEISADAQDLASAEAITAAGGVPVFGPASPGCTHRDAEVVRGSGGSVPTRISRANRHRGARPPRQRSGAGGGSS